MNYPIDVCIAGGSGLVGNELLSILALLEQISTIKAISRSPLGKIPPHVDNIILSFENLEKHQNLLTARVFICCLGTTIKKAGSQEEFRHVDYDFVMSFARIAEKVGAQKFLVISAMCADPDSRIFYNRVKGEMERDLKKLKIPQIEIFRPSLILGERKEKRAGEDWAQRLSPVMNFLLRGSLKKYRGIKASTIAKAMAIATLNFHPGVHIYQSNQIQDIAEKN